MELSQTSARRFEILFRGLKLDTFEAVSTDFSREYLNFFQV